MTMTALGGAGSGDKKSHAHLNLTANLSARGKKCCHQRQQDLITH